MLHEMHDAGCCDVLQHMPPSSAVSVLERRLQCEGWHAYKVAYGVPPQSLEDLLSGDPPPQPNVAPVVAPVTAPLPALVVAAPAPAAIVPADPAPAVVAVEPEPEPQPQPQPEPEPEVFEVF